MPRLILTLVIALVMTPFVISEAAVAAKRAALVIGNADYEHTQALANPGNDARAVAAKLQGMGFDVTLRLDQGYDGMRRSLRDFANKALTSDVAVVFFAGHGMEIGGQNYLVPTDARLKRDVDAEYEAVRLSSVMRTVDNARKLGLVILDACRNNPIASTMQLSGKLTRSVTRGFSRVEPTGEILVAYAAREGTVAEDGAGRHSPYTSALLKHLDTPGLEVRRLFGKIRDDVRRVTGQVQEPATYGSLGGDAIYLVPQRSGRPATASKPRTDSPAISAAKAWSHVEKTTSIAMLEAFRSRYAGTFFADLAAARIEELKRPGSSPGTSTPPSVAPRRPAAKQSELAALRQDLLKEREAILRKDSARERSRNPTRWDRSRSRRFVSIGTGGVTGVYYPTGGAICRLVNIDRKKTNIRCSAESSGGSIYNINTLRAGEYEFGVAQSDWQYHAYHGTNRFASGGPFRNLRSVFSVHPEPLTMIARSDSGIRNITDVKGKRLNIGNPGSGTRGTWEVLAKALGWRQSDLKIAGEYRMADSIQKLCDNQLDAVFWLVGHPSALTQKALASCDVRLVNVWSPQIERLVEQNSFYRRAVIPAKLYGGQTEDIVTFGVGATILTSATVPESVVYNVVKSVFDRIDHFKKLHPAFENLTISEMIKDSLTAPLHKGALKYYRQRGWM